MQYQVIQIIVPHLLNRCVSQRVWEGIQDRENALKNDVCLVDFDMMSSLFTWRVVTPRTLTFVIPVKCKESLETIKTRSFYQVTSYI